MAALTARDSSVRSIRNVSAFARRGDFEERNIEELQTRAEYLQTNWQLFCERNDDLIESARANENAEDTEQHQKVMIRWKMFTWTLE